MSRATQLVERVLAGGKPQAVLKEGYYSLPSREVRWIDGNVTTAKLDAFDRAAKDVMKDIQANDELDYDASQIRDYLTQRLAKLIR